MPSQRDKAKRWRLRWSLRTLVILVTLVCCYAACWGPTKRWGVVDVRDAQWNDAEGSYGRALATAPLIVTFDEEWRFTPINRRYYFWFFGFIAKLPYERQMPIIYLDPPIGGQSGFGSGFPSYAVPSAAPAE